ncbi:hypothetical protein DAI22_02g197132 [Oryza sativa Japonica Group]|nr:hypothetical protein DAI22_02g197132 [Oryza sativa Japonica Group]
MRSPRGSSPGRCGGYPEVAAATSEAVDPARRGRISPSPVVAASLSLSLSPRSFPWKVVAATPEAAAVTPDAAAATPDGGVRGPTASSKRGTAVPSPPRRSPLSLSLPLSPSRRSSPSTSPALDPLFPPLFPASARRRPLRRRRLQLWQGWKGNMGVGSGVHKQRRAQHGSLPGCSAKSHRGACPSGRKRASRLGHGLDAKVDGRLRGDGSKAPIADGLRR